MNKIPEINDETANNFLAWITNHKVYTIFLLLLIIFGMGKIAKHFGDKNA